MNSPPRTERIRFRIWTESDLNLAIGLWGDDKVTALTGGPFTLNQVQARLGSEIAHMREYGVQYWPMFLLENNEHVGCAGLRPYHIEERVYELGVHLRPGFWGRGLAVEAGQAVIAHGFGDLRAESLFAGHHPANDLSKRFLLKLGFAYAHDEFYPPTGLMHPSYILQKQQGSND